MSTIGNIFKVSINGTSHGESISCTVSGLPKGLFIDNLIIKKCLDERRPHKGDSSRVEKDNFCIVQGLDEDFKTTGEDIIIDIPNNDVDDSSYEKIDGLFRPGSGDYINYLKHGANYDLRGGGHSSGRLSAAIVAAGAIAKQLISKYNIIVKSHILKCGEFTDQRFKNYEEEIEILNNNEYPIISSKTTDYLDYIKKIKDSDDSVGGIVETCIYKAPLGLGDNWFDSFAASLSRGVMSIHGVKGIIFLNDVDFANGFGSTCNDYPVIEDGKLKLETNHNSGISAGITTGEPILFQSIIKPTPSISKIQHTVNYKTFTNELIKIEGRHDTTLVRKMCYCIEAVAAIIICDEILKAYKDKAFI